MTAWATTDLAPERIGPYEVLQSLGEGGMGRVFLARHVRRGAYVALKMPLPELAADPDAFTSFRREARLSQLIQDPHVVRGLGVVRHGRHSAIVFEHVEGTTVRSLLGRGPLPPSIATRIAMDTLRGLEAAHTTRDEDGVPLELVHCDIAPDNVMVDIAGVARVADFGLARAALPDETMRRAPTSPLRGRATYLAPEVLDDGEVDARADVFSVGVLLWVCVTGCRPFRGATARGVLRGRVPPPSSIDPALAPLDRVLRTALSGAPGGRYASARDFAHALRAAAEALGGIAPRHALADLVQERLTQRDRLSHAVAVPESSGVRRHSTASAPPPPPLSKRPQARQPNRVVRAIGITLAISGFFGGIQLGTWLGSQSDQKPWDAETSAPSQAMDAEPETVALSTGQTSPR